MALFQETRRRVRKVVVRRALRACAGMCVGCGRIL